MFTLYKIGVSNDEGVVIGMYGGVTKKTPEERLKKHIYDSRATSKSKNKFYKAIIRYGADNIGIVETKVIMQEVLTPAEKNAFEREWIQEIDPDLILNTHVPGGGNPNYLKYKDYIIAWNAKHGKIRHRCDLCNVDICCKNKADHERSLKHRRIAEATDNIGDSESETQL